MVEKSKTSWILNHLWMGIILAVVLVAGFAIITGLSFPPLRDEAAHHFPAYLTFKAAFPNLPLGNYSAASGPLPYIISVLVSQLFPLDLWGLRLLCTISWAAAALLLLFGLQHTKFAYPFLAGIWLISPYILESGLIYGSVGFALPAVVLVTVGGLRLISGEKFAAFWIILGLSLLAWIRQSELFLIIPVAYLFLSDSKGSKKWACLWLLLPLALFSYLAYLWHDVVPPDYTKGYGISPFREFGQITLALCMIGFLLLPLGLAGIKRLGNLTPLALFGGIYSLFFPLPISYLHGVTVRIIFLGGRVWQPLDPILQFLLASWGVLCLAVLWRIDRLGIFLWLMVGAGLLMLMNIGQLWERYHYPLLLPLFLLAASSRTINRAQVTSLVLLQLIVALAMLTRLALLDPNTIL